MFVIGSLPPIVDKVGLFLVTLNAGTDLTPISPLAVWNNFNTDLIPKIIVFKNGTFSPNRIRTSNSLTPHPPTLLISLLI